MATKRRTLPKDFEQMLTTAPVDELKAVFDRCLLDARGGFGKHTALGFVDCPDDLVVWLVEQGLDVDTPSAGGTTPLAARVSSGRLEQLPLLLSLGADIEGRQEGSRTPLYAAARSQRTAAVVRLLELGADPHSSDRWDLLTFALQGTSNSTLIRMAELASVLIETGISVTPRMQKEVVRLGENFEFHRERFDTELLPATDAALAELYRIFDVSPVPRRRLHDGTSPITVTSGTWSEQFAALTDLLVPSGGASQSAQGEVIRIVGLVRDELYRNGGANWRSRHRQMLSSLAQRFASGVSLQPQQLTEIDHLVVALLPGHLDESAVERLGELAVDWVRLNPAPVAVGDVSYAD